MLRQQVTQCPQNPRDALQGCWESDWGEGHQFYDLSTCPVGQGFGCPPAQGPPRPRPYTLEVCLKAPLIHKSWKRNKSQIRRVWPVPGREVKGSRLKGRVQPFALGAGCASASGLLSLGKPWFPQPSLSLPALPEELQHSPPLFELRLWRAPGSRTSLLSLMS